jgi:hypothetical protein
MGLGKRKELAKKFQELTDEAVAAEMNEPNLFSRMLVESSLTVECFREPESALVEIGQKVKLLDLKDRIEVFRGLNSIGYVTPGQVENLRNTLQLTKRKSRSIAAQVIDVSELTPTFVVRVGK